MKEVSYLRNGEVYAFVQQNDRIKNPTIKTHIIGENSLSDLEEVFEDNCRGYITLDKKGVVRAWGSLNLGKGIDLGHWNNYKELKKDKFTNLSFA